VIATIGHSNHSFEAFLQLLKRYDVDAVADARSHPYSSFSPQFDQPKLKDALEAAGIRYVYLGKELGGRPEGNEFYDSNGRALYWKIAESDFFERGLERLESGVNSFRNLALLCSEEDPSICHRHLLIARVLEERGIKVGHIRGDGSIQSERELREAEQAAQPQLALFAEMQQDTWKSIPSVLPKKRRGSSLKPSETPAFAVSSTSV
jgi:uncharacterized protein (DUF488 family)